MTSFPFINTSTDGQKPLISVNQVKNGWIVTVHHPNRDKEVSPETEAKRKLEKEEKEKKRIEDEKTRIKKDLMTQMASMAIIGEAAGQAQARGVDKQADAWKFDDEDEGKLPLNPNTVIKKMDSVINDMAQNSRSGFLSMNDYADNLSSYPVVETHIFTDRQEMIKFVSEMLEPIIE
jgi:hypothetical protein